MPPSVGGVVLESFPVLSLASSVATGASVDASDEGFGLLGDPLELEHPGAAARRADGSTAPAAMRARVEGLGNEMRRSLKGSFMQGVVARSSLRREAPRGHS